MKSQANHQQLLYSRAQAARLLGYTSIDPIIRLERAGRLTPIRLTSPRSQVLYRGAELEAIANGEHEAA